MKIEPVDSDEFFAYLRRAPLDDLLVAQRHDELDLAEISQRRDVAGLSDEECDAIEERFCEVGSRVALRQAAIDGRRRLGLVLADVGV